MSDLVRKGALAADRMSRDAEVAASCDDLARLADFGMLAGVSEIIRERLRQVEVLGYTAEHDDGHADGRLAYDATWYVNRLRDERITGTADPATDEDYLRKAGAMLAAEIDRLNRQVAGQVQRGERHPELGIITPDMQGGQS